MPSRARFTRSRARAISRPAAWWPTGRARGGGTRRARPSPGCRWTTTARPLWWTSSISSVAFSRRVAEQLLEHERDVAHQVDRVVPHEHDPRRSSGVGDVLSVVRRRRSPWGSSLHRRRLASLRSVAGLGVTLRHGRTLGGAMAVGSRPLVPSRLRRVGLGHGERGVPPTRAVRRLRRTHQAADHRAAAHHHGPHDGPRRATAGPPLWLVIATLVGGTLAAGGANAINMYVDRDIDRLMPRTQDRPLVTGRDRPGRRSCFALALEVAGLRRAVGWSPTCSPPCWRCRRTPLLRLRLHAVAQAHEHARTS